MSPTLIILLLLIAGGAGLYYYYNLTPGSKASLKTRYSDGLDLLMAGHRREAYQHFKSIMEKDSNNVKAYLKLGQVMREGGNPKQALKVHTSLSIRLKLTTFEKTELHKNLALDHDALNDTDNAISEVENVLKLNRQNEWALSHLIEFYKKKNEWEFASKYLLQFQEVTQSQDSHLVALYKIQEGRVALDNKDYTNARKLFEESLNIDPEVNSAYLFLGNSYADESETAYRLAVNLDEKEFQTPDEKQQYNEFVSNAKQQLARAIPMWIQYSENDPEGSWLVLSKLKDALYALNRFNEIEDILKSILRKDPDNVDALSSLADFYNQKGARSEALEMIDSALEKQPNSLIANLIKMKLSSYKGDLTQLRTGCDSLMDLFMKDSYLTSNEHRQNADITWLRKNGLNPQAL